MTNDVDYHALAASAAILLLPIISTALSLGGAWFIARRTEKRARAMRNDAKHWRDEAYAIWQKMNADDTVQFRRLGELGNTFTVQDKTIGGPPERRGRDSARHRVPGATARQWPEGDPESPDRLTTRENHVSNGHH
ncbi:hypothetical protein [Amycolatopsis sp. NPDC004079]|uniref:hypothetical protein n=1 Tax=Amycolatopsis sp. NPDC004079 TaxID=3154549 RepID=UPI0033B6859C